MSFGRLVPPEANGKEALRARHEPQRNERASYERRIVDAFSGQLLLDFANGSEIKPAEFDPELEPVVTGTWNATLFRFATLLWSIPVSRGYGRRMRYLVRDRSNGRLVGIFALGDPVFNLGPRDTDIGWSADDREARLYHVMDAYVLGAVPPYNMLLGGKFVALAAVSDQIRKGFFNKYHRTKTVIQRRRKQASLALITTTSALGRSSLYNRLRLPSEDEPVFRRVGYSRGWGHFSVSDVLFQDLRALLRSVDDPYADGHGYGSGPNWRMRTLRRAFGLLGFDEDLTWHGVRREVFLAPLASNYREFLCGNTRHPQYFSRPLVELASTFRTRWMIPRSERVESWRDWTRNDTWNLIARGSTQTLSNS